MLVAVHVRRFAMFAALLSCTALVAACDDDDDDTGPDVEPNVTSMRLTSGTSTVTIDENGECTGCPLQVSDGATVTATFLNPDGEADEVAVPGAGAGARYRLTVTVPTNTVGLAFALSDANSFTGTMNATGTTTTPVNVAFSLRDVNQNENEFGPHNVPVTVVEATGTGGTE